MAFYQYEGLSDTSDQIRILTLHPTTRTDDVLRCSLKVYELDDVPEYRALSYVWGEVTRSRTIQLDGLQFMITTNLHQALTALRRCEQPVSLWVDAICIDQNLIRERNHQVQLMGKIYSLAEQVIIWLGGSDEFGNLAFDMIRLWAGIPMSGSNVDFPDFMHEHPNAFDEHAWRAISQALTQPWWTRIWVYQEYVLARAVLFMFGSATLQEVDLVEASIVWALVREDRVKLGLSKEQVERLDGGIQDGRFMDLYFDHYPRTQRASSSLRKKGLVKLQTTTHDRQSTDARDKIYALLGLDRLSDIRITVDYARSVEEVYTDFAIRCIEDQNSLEIVAFSGMGCATLSPDPVLEMPSWVPDFRSSAMRQREVLEPLTHADSRIRENFCVSADRKSLSCSGILVDILCSTTKPDIRQSFEANAAPPSVQPPAMHLRYPNGTSRIEAMFRTMIFDGLRPLLNSDTVVLPAHNRWVWDSVFGFSYLYGTEALWQLSDDAYKFDDVTESIKKARQEEMYPALFHAWFNKLYSLVTPASLDVNPQESSVIGHNRTLKWPYKFHNLTAERARLHGLELVTTLSKNLQNQSLFGSRKGYIGLGPLHAQAGDEICILFGCSTPMILRPRAAGTHQIVGPCYAYGLMHGEAVDEWKQGRLQSKRFQIR